MFSTQSCTRARRPRAWFPSDNYPRSRVKLAVVKTSPSTCKRAKELKTVRLRRFVPAVFAILFAVSPTSAQTQQTYIGRYDAYIGYADINSPDLGLNESGFHTQGGINLRRWLSVGGDYSIGWGSQLLTTNLLPAALQAQVNAAQQGYIEQGYLPTNYRLAVPTDAFTETFAFGPQLVDRHYSRVSLFLRPSLGALRERATPNPADSFQKVIVAGLAPAGFKLDWTGFYGVGGGGEVALTPHIGLRMQLDAVYNHPFNDILANGRWTFRTSVGTSFHFGRNIAAAK